MLEQVKLGIEGRVPAWSFLLAIFLVGCGVVGNQARINALEAEFASTEFPYDFVLSETRTLAGPNFDRTDVIEFNRISGRTQVDQSLLEVADETFQWVSSVDWEHVVTSCNGDDGRVSAVFIRATRELGGWEARIQFSIGPNDNGGSNVSVFLDAPPVGEDHLPAPPGERVPCWK